MDNPNTRPATSLRRHCSLPATASTSSSRIGSPSFTRTKKHNPYVGWFHHAAGKNLATRSKGAPTLLQQRQHQFKTSPYVGWFTHAPSQQHLLQSFTKAVIRACNDNNVLIWNESLLRSLWRLPGGNPKDSLGSSNNNNNKYGNTNNFTTTTSLTGSLFTKLTCWIFAPPKSHLYPRDYDKCCSSTAKTLLDDASVNNSSLGSDNDSDEESSTTSDTRFITNGNNSATELSVSSQAEAYYAHMTEKTATDYTEAGEHRLDVVITQMDILRMTRNASRHLDVQSILKLPTVVYNQELQTQQQQQKQPTSNATETPLHDTDKDNNNNSSHEKESWSFVDVTDNNNNNAVCIRQDEVTTKNTAQPSDVCVICLEHYQHGESLRVLPCKHTFHVGCIDCWLSGSQSFDDCYTLGCPTCKRDVMSNTVPSWAFAQVGQSL